MRRNGSKWLEPRQEDRTLTLEQALLDAKRLKAPALVLRFAASHTIKPEYTRETATFILELSLLTPAAAETGPALAYLFFHLHWLTWYSEIHMTCAICTPLRICWPWHACFPGGPPAGAGLAPSTPSDAEARRSPVTPQVFTAS